MSASEIIEQIRELPPRERAQVAKFISSDALIAPRKFSIGQTSDGLPVIHANGGSITSQLVHEIEVGTP